MKKKIISFIDKLRPMWVVADPTDDSITLLPVLCRRTHVFDKEKAETIVFRTPDGSYNFCFADEVNELPEDAATWPVQYNTQYYTVGFNCPIPTVNRILYDYGLPAEPRRLRVTVHQINSLIYYKMHAEHSRAYIFKKV